MFYMVEMRSATQEKSFCTDLDSLKSSKRTFQALWCRPPKHIDEAICPNSEISFTSSVFTGEPKMRILKECRVETLVHYSVPRPFPDFDCALSTTLILVLILLSAVHLTFQ